MPELFRPTPFTQELAIRQRNELDHTVTDDKDVSALKDDSATLFPNMDFLGIGSESIVVGYHDQPNKAIAYYYDDSRRYIEQSHLAKYYMHRALSILYPQYFPRFYACAIGEHGGSVRERVDTKPIATKRWYETRKKWQERKGDAYFRTYDEILELGSTIGLKIRLDRNYDNFGLHNNHPVYLDFISSDMERFDIDIGAAVTFIRNRKKAREVNPKKNIPIANGIINEEHAFLESIRRIREFALIEKSVINKTVPSRNDVTSSLIDIGVHMDFETLEEKGNYYDASYSRILRELKRRNGK